MRHAGVGLGVGARDDRGVHRFDGKVALVTGGASGIGAAAVRRLAAEGARVAIADLNVAGAESLADELGAGALAVGFDAGDVGSIERMVATVVERCGRLDVLHNNAALLAPDVVAADTNPVEIDFALWDRVMAVNLRGYLAGCKYALPHMLAQGSGAIVMTASGSGVVGDTSIVAYGCSKAAVIALVKYVATTYGKQGIRCNAINPGLTLPEEGSPHVDAAMVEVFRRSTLTPRLARPEDVAAAVAYLASDDAQLVTGTVLDVNGGFLAHMPYYADVAAAGDDGPFGSSSG
jgi:NAD(P)-dependent dehydrogenase (short-subunit alcohol dehydrogenase family)